MIGHTGGIGSTKRFGRHVTGVNTTHRFGRQVAGVDATHFLDHLFKLILHELHFSGLTMIDFIGDAGVFDLLSEELFNSVNLTLSDFNMIFHILL